MDLKYLLHVSIPLWDHYRGISLLSTTYKILSIILMSRWIPYAEDIIVDHQFGF